MKNSKRRKHDFLNRHTGIGVVLLTVFGFLFVSLVGQLLELLLIVIIPAYGTYALNGNGVVGFGIAAAGLLLLLIYRLWFRPEYRGTLGTVGLRRTAILSCGMLLYWAVGFVPFFVTGGKLHAVSLQAVGTSVMAGFGEEAMFRAVPVSYLARQWRNDRTKIPTIVLVSAAFFALTHAFNVIMGADPAQTALQVVETFGIGVFFGAVYLRGGNLWPLIAVHTINDLLAFAGSDPSELTEHGVQLAGVTWSDAIEVVLCIGLAALGLFIIRKSKRDEICTLWAERWQKPEPAAEQTEQEDIQ